MTEDRQRESPAFSIVRRRTGVIMAVTGMLDLPAAQSLSQQCYELLSLNMPNMAVDLRKTTYLGNAGLCAIAAVGKIIQARRGHYFLALSPPAARVLEQQGYLNEFTIVDEPEAAFE